MAFAPTSDATAVVTESCDFCRWILIGKTKTTRTWRCEDCKHYVDAPVSWRHERVWATRPLLGALPDQETIYDVLGMGINTPVQSEPAPPSPEAAPPSPSRARTRRVGRDIPAPEIPPVSPTDPIPSNPSEPSE